MIAKFYVNYSSQAQKLEIFSNCECTPEQPQIKEGKLSHLCEEISSPL